MPTSCKNFKTSSSNFSPIMSSPTALEHILEVVLGQKPDSPLHRVCAHNAYTDPEDILTETDDVISALKYPDNKKKNIPLEPGNANLLKIFRQYVAHQIT